MLRLPQLHITTLQSCINGHASSIFVSRGGLIVGNFVRRLSGTVDPQIQGLACSFPVSVTIRCLAAQGHISATFLQSVLYTSLCVFCCSIADDICGP